MGRAFGLSPSSMAKKFLSFNEGTGLLTTTGFEDGKNYVRYEQDVTPYLDEAARLRADSSLWQQGVKASWALGARVPDLVIVDMLTRFGVNFYDKNQRKRVLELIEKEYPNCKTTDKRLA